MATPRSAADQLRDAINRAIRDGRTLTEIARAADIGQGVVWRFMNDPHKTLTLDTAHALAKAVGIRLTLG